MAPTSRDVPVRRCSQPPFPGGPRAAAATPLLDWPSMPNRRIPITAQAVWRGRVLGPWSASRSAVVVASGRRDPSPDAARPKHATPIAPRGYPFDRLSGLVATDGRCLLSSPLFRDVFTITPAGQEKSIGILSRYPSGNMIKKLTTSMYVQAHRARTLVQGMSPLQAQVGALGPCRKHRFASPEPGRVTGTARQPGGVFAAPWRRVQP